MRPKFENGETVYSAGFEMANLDVIVTFIQYLDTPTHEGFDCIVECEGLQFKSYSEDFAKLN